MKRYTIVIALLTQTLMPAAPEITTTDHASSTRQQYLSYITPASYILGGSLIAATIIYKAVEWVENYHFLVRIQQSIEDAQALATRVVRENMLIIDEQQDLLAMYGPDGLAAQVLKQCIQLSLSFTQYRQHLIETLQRLSGVTSRMQSTLDGIEAYPALSTLTNDAAAAQTRLLGLRDKLQALLQTLDAEYGYNILLHANEYMALTPYAPVITLYTNYANGSLSFEEYSAASVDILTRWISPQASPFALAIAAGELQKQTQALNGAIYQLRNQPNYGALTSHYQAEERARYTLEALEFLLTTIMRSPEYSQQKKALYQARLEQERLDIERSKIRLQEEQINELRVQTDEIRRQNALLEEKNRIALAKLSYDEEAKKLINALEREVQNYRHQLRELEKTLATLQRANDFLEDKYDDTAIALEEVRTKLKTLIHSLETIKRQLQHPPYAPYTNEYVQWIEQSIIPHILAL